MHVLLKKILAPFRRRTVLDLELVSTRHEYDDTFTYEMRTRKPVRFRAGQYVHLVAPDSPLERASVRHMSPASSPREGNLTFTMDLSSGSPYKKKFLDLKPGDSLKLFGITGGFTLAGLGAKDSIVFIAGGIGITPIRSLIRDMELGGRRRDWVLLHVGREHLYKDEFSQLPNKQYRIGRTEIPSMLDKLVANRPDSWYFVSGSNSFITDLGAMLQERGIPEQKIRTEDFDH